jgi:2-polyprenyl-3-methyl-5-hydroxy-6-metoxy-1,4-benzoquinol methylase
MKESNKKLESDFSEAFTEFKSRYPFSDKLGASEYLASRAIITELSKHLDGFDGKRLLDIGCGPMSKTAIFQLFGCHCFGVDDLSDPWHVEGTNTQKIKNFATQLGINFHKQAEGDYTIPFEESSFDLVTSLSVIEHLHESPREMLNTMGKMAREGGLIVIKMPNSVNLRKRLSVFRGKTNFPPVNQFYDSNGTWRGHVREYTLDEIIYICKRSGFELVSATTFEHLAHEKLASPLREIYLMICNLIPTLRSSLLVVCRKPPRWKPEIML